MRRRRRSTGRSSSLNIDLTFGTEVTAVHGDVSLEAIAVRNRAADETNRVGSGGLFISSEQMRARHG
jgi:hypothetical protein